jgi:hypothetical protein
MNPSGPGEWRDAFQPSPPIRVCRWSRNVGSFRTRLEEMNQIVMKKSFLVLALLALGSLGIAGAPAAGRGNLEQQQSGAAPPDARAVRPAAVVTDAATGTCAFTFTSGTSDDFLKYCVTTNGNMVQFEAPLGHEHVKHGVPGEGYGVCDATTGTEYFDYSFFGDSPNWGEPTVVSQTAKVVKIARTTLDGIWTLTQTFTNTPGTSPFVKLDMTIKNNSTVDRLVFLMRYADVEPDHLFESSMGATSNSAFAWDQTIFANVGLRGNFGLMLQGLALPAPQAFDLGPQGFVEDNTFSDPPPPCNPYKNFIPGTQPSSKGSLVVIYQLGVPKKTAKAVTLNYRGM